MTVNTQEIEIVELEAQAWEQYKKLRLRALKEEPSAFSTSYDEMMGKDDRYWKTRLIDASKDRSWMLFARKKSELLGMVTAALGDRGIVQVHGVFVVAEARGMGIGNSLMNSLLTLLSDNPKVKQIYLDLNTNQTAAVRLYEKCGFKIVDEFEEQLGNDKKYPVYVMFREP